MDCFEFITLSRFAAKGFRNIVCLEEIKADINSYST